MEGTPKPQPNFRAKLEDLTAEEQLIGDHIFPLLEECNRVAIEVNDASRKVLWKKVFLNWDTTKPINKPKLPKRTAEAYSIPVGTLVGHDPVPVVGTDTHITGDRCAHAEAFLKIIVDHENMNLNYAYTNARRRIVPSEMVHLHEGLTVAKSRSMLLHHYDKHEIQRVSAFNEGLVVYWARQKLVAKMEDDAAGSPEPSQRKQYQDLNYGQLVQLKLATDVFDLMKAMADAVSPRQSRSEEPFNWEERMKNEEQD